MDKLRQKFLEEAFEHVGNIEQSMLDLENDSGNQEFIEKIFRAMHTLKGSGAMFGFEKVSKFTHNLETIYDLIRNSKLDFSKDIADLTLHAVDFLKMMLSTAGELTEDEENDYNLLTARIQSFVNPDKKEVHTQSGATAMMNEFNDIVTYYIYFKPNPTIFDNGTNPLFLIDELVTLGSAYCIPYMKNIPLLNAIDPHKCYTHWEIILATKEPLEAINDVFIFVENNCSLDIHKLGNGNFLQNKKFIRRLESLKETGEDAGIDGIIKITQDIEQSVAFKIRKALNKELKSGIRDYSISSIRVASEKLNSLLNLVSELVTTQARLGLYSEQNDSPELTAISENIHKITKQLRDLTFEIALVPVETLITRFQRLVRDLSTELNKEVVFEAKGTDTELDKTIIENLTDPLMHIIRNCIDHGIESREERMKKNKSPNGRILLNAYHSSTNVHIEIEDDGKGIDVETIRKKAISKGIIGEATSMNEKQLFELLFMPGFSTSENVTGVSGRGVGMDVVRQKIAGIRGEIELSSQKDRGTKIILKIPITLSIIDGLLVKVEETFFIIALSSIHKIYAIDYKDITNNYNQLITLDEEKIPYFSLRDEFRIASEHSRFEQVVVIQYDRVKVGLVVDQVIGEYQAVLKPLGKHYRNQDIISAATILGDGTIALVIDTNKAIHFFSNQMIQQEESI